MLSATRKAIGQIGDPAFKRVLWRGVLGALAVYLALAFGTWVLLAHTTFFGSSWLDWAVHLLGGLAAFIVPLFLFPATAGLIIGIYLEDIARAVEARHYPGLPPAAGAGIGQAIVASLRFAGIAIALNLVALVLVYWIPVVNLVVFVTLNGYLLGREYFEAVALRRLQRADAAALRKRHGARLWIDGAIITFLMSIPVANLAAPVLAMAVMVHELEALRRRA
jgi:CysZ protein